MSLFPHRVGARFGALVRADLSGVRAGFVALLISTGTDLVAGLTLGSITGHPREAPRPPHPRARRDRACAATCSARSAAGSGTAVHTGTFRLSCAHRHAGRSEPRVRGRARRCRLAFLLAIVAKGFAVAFGVNHAISIADFVVVSVIGGIIPIVVVMAITIAVATLSVRNDWDLDNVAAPVVTAAGDSVTLPSLFLATAFVQRRTA